MKAEIVISYIDGFNLYFGLKAKKWQRYYWMDMDSLSINLLKKHQFLSKTHYFTSRITRDPDKQRRQNTYLEALTAVGTKPTYGKYRHNRYRCFSGNSVHMIPQEKMTDVAMAVQLLSDGYANKYDMALVISGDIDLLPAIKHVKQRLQGKRVIMAFPPLRENDGFDPPITDGNYHIDERICKKSQLPDVVERADGFELKRPVAWA